MNNTEKDTDWFVVRTKQNAEKKVEERLRDSGYVVFLPLLETIRVWSDRKKKLQVPLIPGHVFVFTDKRSLVNLYNIPGVSYVLTEFGRPAIVREQEINNLRILAESGFQPEWFDTEMILDGDDVEVIAGPFQGMFGTCVKAKSNYILNISFPNIKCAFSVSINRNQVRRIKN